MNKILIVTAALSLQSCATYMPPPTPVDGQQVFDCRERFSDNYSVLIRATATPAENNGTVMVAGVIHQASYEVSGFDREWRFGSIMADGGIPYAFIIKPDGTGYYFDFTLAKSGEHTVSSSDSFECYSTY